MDGQVNDAKQQAVKQEAELRMETHKARRELDMAQHDLARRTAAGEAMQHNQLVKQAGG